MTTPPDLAADTLDADISTDETRAFDGGPLLTKGGKKRRGVCFKCGAQATSRSSTLCEDHAILAPDAAPRRVHRARPDPTGNLATELRVNLELVGQIIGVRDPTCGAAVVANAGPIAGYWAERAAQSERTAAVLASIVSSGGWLGAIGVHAPLIVVVFGHHVTPVLEARREAAAAAAAGAVDNPHVENIGTLPAEPWVPSPEDVIRANGEPLVPWDQLPSNYPPEPR